MTTEFKLEGESIELYKLLKLLGLCESGAAAKHIISEGKVTVDNQVETRKRCKIKRGQRVRLDEEEILLI